MTAWLCLSACLAVPSGVLVDRIVAVVDKEVITYSEVLREARVALVMREGYDVASADLGPELVRSFLNYLVDQVLVANQARRMGDSDVSAEDVDAEVERFARCFRTNVAHQAFLRRFDISEAALRDILRRDLRNERYLAERMRAWRLMGEVGTDGGRYREAVARWLRELRQGAELRVLNTAGELELERERGREEP